MSFLEEIKKQPRHVREMMFGFCVITTISIIGMIWFRSFEEDLFVLLNPESEKQDKFYAERDKRTPAVYANITKAVGDLRANLYNVFGFFEDYNSGGLEIEKEYKGKAYQLPISEDK